MDLLRACAQVEASVDGGGGLTVSLIQGASRIHSFDPKIGGNPQGRGVPGSALADTKAAMGKLALVASLWTSDTSWLDGDCQACNLEQSYYLIGTHIRALVQSHAGAIRHSVARAHMPPPHATAHIDTPSRACAHRHAQPSWCALMCD